MLCTLLLPLAAGCWLLAAGCWLIDESFFVCLKNLVVS